MYINTIHYGKNNAWLRVFADCRINWFFFYNTQTETIVYFNFDFVIVSWIMNYDIIKIFVWIRRRKVPSNARNDPFLSLQFVMSTVFNNNKYFFFNKHGMWVHSFHSNSCNNVNIKETILIIEWECMKIGSNNKIHLKIDWNARKYVNGVVSSLLHKYLNYWFY